MCGPGELKNREPRWSGRGLLERGGAGRKGQESLLGLDIDKFLKMF